MTKWQSISIEARHAAALLLRDRRAGERQFDVLLRSNPGDGMLFFERGTAFAQLGETAKARLDLEAAAQQFPVAKYKRMALSALERLPRLDAVDQRKAMKVDAGAGGPVCPSAEQLRRAHEIFAVKEKRAVDFDVAARLLDQVLSGPHALSPAVPVALLLQSWNFAHYQDGREFDAGHFTQLESTLRENRGALEGFRKRSIDSLSEQDESNVRKVFAALAPIAGRVGAAKTPHLWAPNFFPLWDNPIAQAYGFDLSDPTSHYWTFMLVVRAQVVRIEPPSGVSSLEPAAIIAFTFTDRAATALKVRIIKRVAESRGSEALDRLRQCSLGMIHATLSWTKRAGGAARPERQQPPRNARR